MEYAGSFIFPDLGFSIFVKPQIRQLPYLTSLGLSAPAMFQAQADVPG
jgi:hypothetical protein